LRLAGGGDGSNRERVVPGQREGVGVGSLTLYASFHFIGDFCNICL